MSDRQTLKRQIIEELDKPNDGDAIDRAICEALRYLRSESFWFNRGRLEIATTAEQWEYPLPSDFVSLYSDLFFQDGDSETSRRRMTFRPSAWVEENKHVGTDPFHIGDWEAGIQYGPPHSFTIHGDNLLLTPIPDTSGDLVIGPYTRDLGTPIAKYSGSAWVFYEPDGATTLPADFTNAWFTDGQDALRSRAIYYIQQNVYRDLDGTQLAMSQYLDAVNRLRKRSVGREGGGNLQIRGYL